MSAYQIHKLKVSNNMFINFTYIIVDTSTKSAAIVDPSWDLTLITDTLDQEGADLKAILLTHAHVDHVNLVKPLVSSYHPTVYMHQAEIHHDRFQCDNLIGVSDLEEIVLGDTSIVCVWTPGHTVGSTCYLLKNDLFTGDTLFSEGVGVCFSERGGNPRELYKSTQRLKSMVPDHIRIHPGHSFGYDTGRPFCDVYKTNIYLHLNEEDFVAFRMRANQPALFGWQQ